MLILFLPVLFWVTGFDIKVPLFENRTLNPFLSFDIKKPFEFPKKFDGFYSDNYALRTFFISVDNFLKVKILKSSTSNEVVIGKDDWLFLIPPQFYPQVLNAKPYSENELLQIKNNLKKMSSYFGQKNIKFYFLIAPNSQTIYPEFLPDSLQKRQKSSQLDQLTQYLISKNADINFINPVKNLSENKKLGQIYYRHNNHWNNLGAFIAYGQLIDYIKSDFPKVKKFEISDFEISFKESGVKGLEGMMGLRDYYHEQEPVLTPKFKVRSKKMPEDCLSITARCADLTSEINDPQLPSAVVFRDSFFQAVIPFFAENFKKVHYIWKVLPLSTEVVNQEKPDLVILEITDQNMDVLTQDIFSYR